MTPYTSRERFWLIVSAAIGGVGLNGVFLYGALHTETVGQALHNPIAIAFVLEAFLLVIVLAWLIDRWRLSRLSWPWFLFLSLLGGLAFALPVALVWGGGSRATNAD